MDIQLPDSKCTGCGSCVLTCPVRAITMKEHTDGFFYPDIDRSKCVRCTQCMKACHVLQKPALYLPSACYAVQIKDKQVLNKSTSGGMFFALAREIFSKHGVVYGCVYDDEYNAVIQRAETLEQLLPMHGSKYVWSDPSKSYPAVKQDVEEGRIVLYTGLPCQVAGLCRYLKKKYDTLYTVDILCGGAPSPYSFKRYLDTLADATGKIGLNFQFRDKDRFGSGVNCTYTVNGIKHYENYLENSFYFAFSSKSRITWRESCYSCDYKSIKRVSDMTIGDYWGVENHHKKFNPKDGVSVVLINTEQGRELFESVKSGTCFEESKVEYATERNSLVREIEDGHVKLPADRNAFFRTLRTDGWNTADNKFLTRRKKMLLKMKVVQMIKRLKRILK